MLALITVPPLVPNAIVGAILSIFDTVVVLDKLILPAKSDPLAYIIVLFVVTVKAVLYVDQFVPL